MGLTRRELLKIRKIKYLEAVIRKKRRRHIELAMQSTMLNQLKAEIAQDRKRAA